MFNENLGDRMKKYEHITRTHLTPRTPAIIRVDGRAFHTFTRGFKRPFDEVLVAAMQRTMQYLCENVQGCVLGYTQSDEISLVLVDYKKLTSAAWFDYNIQKCASIAASMATMAFNSFFAEERSRFMARCVLDHHGNLDEEHLNYGDTLFKAMVRGAMFDARIFSLPREEVCNYIYWRQIDATRNSIQMVGQSQFSHRELQNKSSNDIQEMLFSRRGINWNDFPDHLKRGACCIRTASPDNPERQRWMIDVHIPVFKGEDRSYVERLIEFPDPT